MPERRRSGLRRPRTTSRCYQAVHNTQHAASYSEVVSETTPQGTQTDYLVYQAPDKLGGYIQSGNRRTYVYVIGNKEYQSITVTANTPDQAPGFLRAAQPRCGHP